MTLFDDLKAHCADDWEAYTRHEFVRRLGDGTLPEACFRHYLMQDYLFLIQFSRCYALAAYKAETLEEMRHATEAQNALINVELDLHLEYCASWGIDPTEIEMLSPEPANKAYTDYVMACGEAEGTLALRCALAPCVLGYGEIGSWLDQSPDTARDGNPYASWIAMYAGEEYQSMARGAVAHLDQLAARDGDTMDIDRLRDIFREATRLEVGFWDMGMHPPSG